MLKLMIKNKKIILNKQSRCKKYIEIYEKIFNCFAHSSNGQFKFVSIFISDVVLFLFSHFFWWSCLLSSEGRFYLFFYLDDFEP